jgi:23S rRNA (adenine2030-N6)-methyltransferase
MHYRHSYHAGNFADAFKHVLLCGLLASLNRKDKPWCYLDTHAGAGIYDLGSEGATRTSEWRDGVGRLAGLGNAPEPLATYLRIVREQQPASHADSTTSPVLYPGSPEFARRLSRPTDRLLLCEKVTDVVDDLRYTVRGHATSLASANGDASNQIAIHVRDGYEAQSLLPPPEKRGLVLVDPPFERTDEFAAMAEFTAKAVARFANGIYALWYPIKNRHAANGFARRIGREVPRPSMNFEFDNGAEDSVETSASGVQKHPLHACGLLVVNPPFQFAQEMAPSLKILAREMSQGAKPKFSSEWVRPE